jgi:hypothetical protein
MYSLDKCLDTCCASSTNTFIKLLQRSLVLLAYRTPQMRSLVLNVPDLFNPSTLENARHWAKSHISSFGSYFLEKVELTAARGGGFKCWREEGCTGGEGSKWKQSYVPPDYGPATDKTGGVGLCESLPVGFVRELIGTSVDEVTYPDGEWFV